MNIKKIIIIHILIVLMTLSSLAHATNSSVDGKLYTAIPETTSGSGYHLNIQFDNAPTGFDNLVQGIKTSLSQFGDKFFSVWSGYAALPEDTANAFNTLSDNQGYGYVARQFTWFFLPKACCMILP